MKSLSTNISNSDKGMRVKQELNRLSRRSSDKDFFIIQPVSSWLRDAAERPIPRMLFDGFWFEKEICILFADTNVGKSILAYQIGNSISKGEAIPGFRIETRPQKVLYLDFELSDKQIEKRFSDNYKNHYQFDQNFLRGELNMDGETPEKVGFEDHLINSIEESLAKNSVDVLIVDNITYLNQDNEKGKNALSLMKRLKKIGKIYDLSILILAHTPKRNKSKPLRESDLAGSKMLINFCDSAFAIGDSRQDPNWRYIKQIKVRATEKKYHDENVAICEINGNGNFLRFNLLGFEEERSHLMDDNQPKENRNETIIKMHKEGLSNVAIAEELGVSEGTVRYVLNKANG